MLVNRGSNLVHHPHTRVVVPPGSRCLSRSDRCSSAGPHRRARRGEPDDEWGGRAARDPISLALPTSATSALLDLVAQDGFGEFAADWDAYGEVGSVDEWIALTRSGNLRLREFYSAHPGLAALIQATATRDRDQGVGSRASLVGAQIQALVRLGVPAPEARHIFEACARWTMAAVATESHVGGGDDDDRFGRGLDWLLHGVQVDLARIIGAAGTVKGT